MGEFRVLADVAGRDVVLDVGCHTGPGVIAAYKFECFLYTVVTGRAFVVGLVEERCAEVVVVGDVYEVVVRYEIVVEGEIT